MSCIDEALNPGTRRAAGIRPYEMVHPIQRALSENPSAVGPLQSALRAASFPRGKLLEGAEAGTIQRGVTEVVTLRGDKLPPPTGAKGFSGFRSTGSSGPRCFGRLVFIHVGGMTEDKAFFD